MLVVVADRVISAPGTDVLDAGHEALHLHRRELGADAIVHHEEVQALRIEFRIDDQVPVTIGADLATRIVRNGKYVSGDRIEHDVADARRTRLRQGAEQRQQLVAACGIRAEVKAGVARRACPISPEADASRHSPYRGRGGSEESLNL